MTSHHHRWTALLAAGIASSSLLAAPQPNIVLIMADDFGYECVSANGCESYQTPNLDRLAEAGIRFTHCYVQPLCTPTRVQLMTGLYNVRNYIEFGLLDPNATTFAQVFKQAGYATGIVGKWQLGREQHLPKHFGFDESCLWQHTRRPPRFANPGLEINGVEKDYTNGEYGPELVNDFALGFIERHRDHPFLLYYPMILTHDPFQPTPESANWDPKAQGEKVNRRPEHFADMAAYADKMVGRVIEQLDAFNLRDRTLIIFLGDNGTHRRITTQFRGASYVGGKGKPTAAGTHVPLIVSWPTRIPSKQVCDDLVDSTDFFPTLCDASGIPYPASLSFDGRTFWPRLQGKRAQAREWIYCWYARNGGPTATHEFAMNQHFKLYRDGRLYSLVDDPLELSPLRNYSPTDDAETASRQLRSVLEQFTDARPAHLR
jgi:arylsulfatase A